MSLQEIASLAAIVLTFVAYAPYLATIRTGVTRPHYYSWLIWSLTTAVVFVAQLSAEGGVGAWPTGVSAAITIYVTWLAWRLHGDTQATRLDQAFLGMALLSLPLWLLTADPLWAVVILTTVDVLGFGPTLRKAWHLPWEESLLFYALFTVRSALSVLALESLNLTTLLFPVAMVLACLVVCALLWWRRRVLPAGTGIV